MTTRLADLADARRAFARATAVVAGAPCVRVEAARHAARLTGQDGDWSGSASDYRTAVELLPRATPRRLARGDQEHQLSEFVALAQAAAAACLQAKRPTRCH